MSHCTVDRRAEARDAADQLAATPTVAHAEVLAPDEGPQDEWTIEVTIGRTRVPAEVHLALGAHGLATVESKPRPASNSRRLVAVVPR